MNLTKPQVNALMDGADEINSVRNKQTKASGKSEHPMQTDEVVEPMALFAMPGGLITPRLRQHFRKKLKKSQDN